MARKKKHSAAYRARRQRMRRARRYWRSVARVAASRPVGDSVDRADMYYSALLGF